MIDYQEIIKELNDDRVKDLLDRLEVPYQDKGQYLVCKTACHHADVEEASWKLYFYKNTKVFVCYSSCQTMSIFKFLKHYYEARDIDYNWVEDIYNVVLDCSSYSKKGFAPKKYRSIKEDYQRKRETIELPIYSDRVLESFEKFYPPEWLEDGITPAAMDKFDILYSVTQNKIIIPHRNAEGSLVGIRGRALDEWEVENVGKYMPIRVNQQWYSHPLGMNLYGLYENKKNIKEKGVVYLAEGEKSVLQAESFSFPNCTVAVCGSNFSKWTLNLLMRECQPKEIIICFDKEDNTGGRYFSKLYNLCKKYDNYSNFSFIFDRNNQLELKDSPFDRGEEVFLSLLKKRVRVR